MTPHELDVDFIPRQSTPERVRLHSDCAVHPMGPRCGCHDWMHGFGWLRTCKECGATVMVFERTQAPSWSFIERPVRRKPPATPPSPSFWVRFRQWTKS